jgi:TetR/AcrR family transcriptional regulator, transcriptional repressor of bet genes
MRRAKSIRPRARPVRPGAPPAPARGSRQRQRQRLIDACISALHLHGPSHTTVERVVALADLSPGIVRFYFDSKDAMLVASLEYLAAEFEERLLAPVARLKHTPVQALERLVELYLDPEIASTRKVSVWYAFWGEASSRQEYLEICGGKDEDFAALVRELIERLIIEAGTPHLDADAVSLGLIGVLEVLWQGFAFQSEESIDRAAARRRSMAYLRSVFPAQFGYSAPRPARLTGPEAAPGRLPAWAYADRAQYAAERARLFSHVWELAGHESELAAPGRYLTREFASERVLVVRDAATVLRAYRNSCPVSPHALLGSGAGLIAHSIDCSLHELRFDLEGKRVAGDSPANLLALELIARSGLLFMRAPGALSQREGPAPDWSGWPHVGALELSAVSELDVAADWKLIVEQWLEFSLTDRPRDTLAALAVRPHIELDEATGTTAWQATLSADAPGWTAARYARLAARADSALWQRLYLPPHQLIEIRPDGVAALQVLPQAPGQCRVRRYEYRHAPADPLLRALGFLGARLTSAFVARQIEIAQSTQAGLSASGYPGAQRGPVPAALAHFRAVIGSLLNLG